MSDDKRNTAIITKFRKRVKNIMRSNTFLTSNCLRGVGDAAPYNRSVGADSISARGT